MTVTSFDPTYIQSDCPPANQPWHSDDPNEIPLDQYVFNTEAHPLPIWDSLPERTMRHKMEELARLRREDGEPVFTHSRRHAT